MIATLVLAAQVSVASSAPVQAPPSLNQAVVAFCRNRIGKKVGSGQCADLAAQALIPLKAMSRSKDAPNPGDYVWGRLIATLTPQTIGQAQRVLPGDVVQYRDIVFEHRTPTYWSQSTASHHTSVISSVRPGVLTVFEQNVNGRMTVGTTDLTLSDLKQGTLWVYRPGLQRPSRRRN